MAFDLDKVIAEEEADAAPFTFTFDGESYELPLTMDTFALTAITDGRAEEGLTLLLGAEQFDRLKASPKVFSIKAMDALLNEYATHMGFANVGESAASPRLLNRTARRSKPTSNAGTKSGSQNSEVR